ncbi:MAG TPA: helix-turn-helix domain-containing protein [Solirubrobacterales bacterium]|nr:helix-turn-helix domain-containing protein [Solirubrobacterales bacterium]
MRIAPDDSRRTLLAALRARRPEIDRAVLSRVRAIGEAGDPGDAEYRDGLRRAVEAAIGHTIDSIGRSEDSPLPVPLALLTQARLAARRRLPLETMLRRYLAGHAVLVDFVAGEAVRQGVPPALIGPTLRSLATRTDLTVATISAAYVEEQTAERPSTPDARRAGLVRRLLGGEMVDPVALDYDLDRWHLALVLRGGGTHAALDALAGSVDAYRLTAADEDDSVWVWLGSRERIEPRSVAAAMSIGPSDDLRIGIGEPGRGRDGWRLTHEQAQAALSVAIRGPQVGARYADVSLLASAVGDELLSTSLRRLYLEPLEAERNRGEVLRETLRAYFAAQGNLSSAAAALGVSRKTVNSRLRTVEKRIGFRLSKCGAPLELAVQMAYLFENAANKADERQLLNAIE